MGQTPEVAEEVAGNIPVVLSRSSVAVVDLGGENVVEVALLDRLRAGRCAGDQRGCDGQPDDE